MLGLDVLGRLRRFGSRGALGHAQGEQDACRLVPQLIKQVLEQDEMIFHAVKQVIIASLYGHPQPLVVESARSGLGHHIRPGLNELLDALRGR